MKDKLIKCPLTGHLLCCEIETQGPDSNTIKTYISMSSGFWTNSLMKPGEDFYEQQMESLPQLYKDLAIIDDEFKLTWIPSNINLPQVGMVYASGTGVDSWGWEAIKYVKVQDFEKEKFKIPNTKNQYYEYKSDKTTLRYFNPNEFLEAADYIGVPFLNNNPNEPKL
jgi:hypothetical protein